MKLSSMFVVAGVLLPNIASVNPKKSQTDSKKCNCLQMKELRDITPLYPVMKSWLANKWIIWRDVQREIGVGSDVKLSNLRMGHFISSL